MRSFSEKAAIGLSSIMMIAAISVAVLAILFRQSKTYEVFESQGEAVAVGAFAGILAVAGGLLALAILAFFAVRKRSKGLQICFAVVALSLVLFLTFAAVVVFDVNRYTVEMISDPDGKADPGLLSSFGFQNDDFRFTQEQRAEIALVNKIMCSAGCPCDVKYRSAFKGTRYATSVFLPISPLLVDAFYPTCYQRNPLPFPDIDEVLIKVLNTIEKLWRCSGIKDKLLWYVTLDIKEGPPEKSCGDVLIEDAQSKVYMMALVMSFCAAYLWILLIFQLIICLGCDKKIKKTFGHDDDDNFRL